MWMCVQWSPHVELAGRPALVRDGLHWPLLMAGATRKVRSVAESTLTPSTWLGRGFAGGPGLGSLLSNRNTSMHLDAWFSAVSCGLLSSRPSPPPSPFPSEGAIWPPRLALAPPEVAEQCHARMLQVWALRRPPICPMLHVAGLTTWRGDAWTKALCHVLVHSFGCLCIAFSTCQAVCCINQSATQTGGPRVTFQCACAHDTL